MASMRAFTEFGSEWAGCGRDAFDIAPSRIAAAVSRRKVADRSRKLLARTIEAEIIPLLVTAHREVTPARIKGAEVQPSREEVVEFVRLLLAADVTFASAFVEALCARGTPLETVFLNLFTPSARLLGRLWDEDICDFTDVTIALSRLQQLLRELGAAFDIAAEQTPCERSALIVAAPGDQHAFGAFILQEFFRRAGWDVRGGSIASNHELLSLAESGPFDLVGLSVSNEITVDRFASVLSSIRDAVAPRMPVIMVGGRFFLDHPDCVRDVGADATAQDGRRAVLRVSSLLGTNALR
jgi:MerR family transcriptional regulator, light-induced transcriptional regulator